MDAYTHKARRLESAMADRMIKSYRKINKDGEKKCPANSERPKGNKRGRIAPSQARHRLERLRDFEEETSKFSTHHEFLLTHHCSESDTRMNKTQQEISGCFCSKLAAKKFRRIRRHLLISQNMGSAQLTFCMIYLPESSRRRCSPTKQMRVDSRHKGNGLCCWAVP